MRLSPCLHVPGKALRPILPLLPVSPCLMVVRSRMLVVWVSLATVGPYPQGTCSRWG